MNHPLVGNVVQVINAAGETTYTSPEQHITPSEETRDYTYVLIDIGGENIKRTLTASSAGNIWTYAYSDSAGILTTTVTAPDGGVRTVMSNIADQTVLSDEDALGRKVTYEYDSDQRVTKITSPSGTFSEYTYDARGNITQVKQSPSSGSAAPIITYASYPTNCSNAVTCNKPIWTKDARGLQTDYIYDSTHGGVLSVTGPAPSSGAARPQIRYSYTQQSAKVKDSAGGLIDAAPIWRMTGISMCATGSSCTGTADETKIIQTYLSTRNLIPRLRVIKAGDNSVSSSSYGYTDFYGNPSYVDGPLTGIGDRTYFQYDNAQRLLAIIGPDPDGSGPLLHPAQKYTYADGQLVKTELGTATSKTAWTSFAALQSTETVYDEYGRAVKSTAKTGTTTHAVQQISYDNKSRPICAAVRMNPAIFDALPADACTLGAAGVFGPDRIGKIEYNLTDQVLKTTAGYGTDAASMEETVYWANGNVKYLRDGNANQTYYRYDTFNRPWIKYFPNASGGGHNASDREVNYYDIYGRQYSQLLRDGSVVSSTFDDLGRATALNAPGTNDDMAFTYDNFGRVLTTSKNGEIITTVYDALSRRQSETTQRGTVSYQYDLAGRGTKITYPDGGFYVNYDYNTGGQVTAIRENGAVSGIGVLAAYEYDNLGRRTKLTRGNGTVTDYGFDVASRLTLLDNDAAGTSDDQTLTFTHTPSGQIATRTASNAAYDWDGAGIVSETYSVNGLNQVISAAFGNMTYDARGNTISAGAKTYSYDIYNQLTSVNGAGTNAVMDYDPFGRLSSITGSGVITKFGYSGTQMITEYDSSDSVLRRYVHGAGVDEHIVWYEGADTSDPRFMMTDNQGSITAITDDTGAVTDKNTYNEYGVPGTGNTGRFQYTGQVWLAEAQVYHYKARAYDPYLGRFLQTDPIGYAAGMNMYAYVGGDPVNLIDPSGLHPGKPGHCHPTPTGTLCQRNRKREIHFSSVAYTPIGVTTTIPGFAAGPGISVPVLDDPDSEPPEEKPVDDEESEACKAARAGLAGADSANVDLLVDMTADQIRDGVFGSGTFSDILVNGYFRRRALKDVSTHCGG